MEFRGARAYDQTDFLSNYLKRRRRQDSPNNAIEGPIIYELIGDFHDKNILDLGCGDASFGKEILNQGARHYTGVEGSKQMAVNAETNLFGKNGTIHNDTMESYTYPTNEYEIVTSRFAKHYVSDIDQLFLNVYKSLKENGNFIFSVQHPLTTSSFAERELDSG